MSVELLSGLGAILAAALAWLSSRWVRSGRIRTSEAEVLWKAAETIRAELRTEIQEERKRADTLASRYEDLRIENEMLLRENLQLREQYQPPGRRKDEDIKRLLRTLHERTNGEAK